EQLDDAVLERLAADEADVGVPLGLPDEVLTAAEADLQPHLAHRVREEVRQATEPLRVAWHCNSRQQFLPQRLLPGARRPPTSAPVAAQVFLVVAIRHCRPAAPAAGLVDPPPACGQAATRRLGIARLTATGSAAPGGGLRGLSAQYGCR